jgi:hypothetical protein
MIKKPREQGGHGSRWAAEPEMMMMIIIIIIIIIIGEEHRYLAPHYAFLSAALLPRSSLP